MKLRALAPGKVNLSLLVGGLRDDGRHEVVTVLEAVSLADTVTLEDVPGLARDEVICAGVPGPNLVEATLGSLRAHGWEAPPVRVEIEKRIPLAGGMAGGSADAAATLRMALAVGELRPGTVARVAASLGADVPSQLAPGLVSASGAGELIEPLPPAAPHAIVLVPLAAGLSSGEVYGEADRLGLLRSEEDLRAQGEALREALRLGGAQVADELLVNDLQAAAVSLCPEIDEALSALDAVGAERALVSGSGPTSAGIYWGEDAAVGASEAARELRGRFPGAVSVTPVGPEYGAPQPL